MSEPSKTITLSDGSKWEYKQDRDDSFAFPWSRCYVDSHFDVVAASIPWTATRGHHLTASDHRKIADVLDGRADAEPPPPHRYQNPTRDEIIAELEVGGELVVGRVHAGRIADAVLSLLTAGQFATPKCLRGGAPASGDAK